MAVPTFEELTSSKKKTPSFEELTSGKQSIKSNGIVAEPVNYRGEFYNDLDLSNPVDRKILEYRRINDLLMQEAEERVVLEQRRLSTDLRMKQQRKSAKRKKTIENYPKSPFEWGGVIGMQAMPTRPTKITDKAIEAIERTAPKGRRELVQDIGGVIGGLSGKNKLGAAMGGMIGEAGYQIGQQAAGSPEKPTTSIEAAKRIGLAGARQFGEEFLSNVLTKTISPGGRIPAERRATIKWMREKGIEPTLFQATGSKGAVGILEGVASASFTGGPGFAVHKQVNEELLEVYKKDLLKSLGGMTSKQAGEVIQTVLLDNSAARKAIYGKAYDEAKRLSLGKLIKSSPFKKALQQLGDELLVEGMPALNKSKIKRLIDQGLEYGDYIPYKEYDKITKALGDLAYPQFEAAKIFGSNESRLLKQAHHKIKFALLDPKNGLPKEAIDLIKKADFLVEDTRKIWDTDLVKDIVKQYPEHVVNKIFGSGGEITKVGEVIGAGKLFEILPSKTKQPLRGAFVQDLLLNKGTKNELGERVLDGVKVLNIIENKQGRDVLNQFMTKNEIGELINLGNALKIMREKPIQLGGGLTIKILQASALMSLAYAAAPGEKSLSEQVIGGGAGAILLGPKAVEYIFTSPKMVKQFTNTLIAEGTPKQTMRALVRFFANPAIRKIITDETKERADAAKEKIRSFAEEQKYQPL